MNKIATRKALVYGLYILLATIATFSLSDIINYEGVTPEYFLILCVLVGYSYGTTDVIPLAIISGFIKDIFAGRIIGLSILIFLYIGIIASVLFKKYITKNIIVFLGQLVVASAIYSFAIYSLIYIFHSISYSLIEYSSWVVLQRFIPMLILNLLIGIIFYLLFQLFGPYSKKIDIFDEVVTTKISKI